MIGSAQDDGLTIRLLRDVRLEFGGVVRRGSLMSLPAEQAQFMVATNAAAWVTMDTAGNEITLPGCVRVGDPSVSSRDPTLARQ